MELAGRGQDGTGRDRMVERINDDSSQPEIIKGSWYVEKEHFIGTGGSRWLLVVQSIQLYKMSFKK